ncbi:MAG: helix-turn-helix domain-containing protein, partial [FCB group bacterium]|nr:helix-turn-helix domain-containing protein [FCB group bacterium]
MESPESFGSRLRELRLQRRLSKADLAVRAHLSWRTVHDLEAGRRENVLEKTILLLATALGVSPEEIRGEIATDALSERGRARARGRFRLTALLSLAVILALGAGSVLWRVTTGRAEWVIHDQGLVARDGLFGIEVWSINVSCGVIFATESPWSSTEILVGLGAIDATGGRVLCLDRRNGAKRWEATLDKGAVREAFGPEVVDAGNFWARRVFPVDLTVDGEMGVIVEFLHKPNYPDVFCIIGRDGRLYKQYTLKGHSSDALVNDINQDDE